MAIQLFTDMTGTTALSLSYPYQSSVVYSRTSSNVIFLDSSSPIVLGGGGASFKGFIYQIIIYSTIEDVSSLAINVCINDASTNCLWGCVITQYLLGNTCTSCNSSCTGGCIRGSDCNLCNDVKCNNCLNFTSIGYYLNNTICYPCSIQCLQCIGPLDTQCSSCHSNAFLQNNGACACNQSYYLADASIAGTCTACDSSCLTCNGGTYYQCTSCVNYLLENICLPECPVGYSTLNNTCITKFLSLPVVQFNFTTIGNAFTDSINSLIAIGGNNNCTYPNFDSTNPLSAYERGLYFTGNGSYLSFPYNDNKTIVLGIRFFISI